MHLLIKDENLLKKESQKIVEFTLFYNRYKTKVFNYTLRMVGDRLISEDIVQNVFLKFFENMDLIRNKNSFNYWIFKTARNEIYSYFRNKKIRVDQFAVTDIDEIDISSGDNLANELELNEVGEIIKKELGEMDFEQREVFVLKEYSGMSYKEISQIMSIDENLVKSRLYNTRQRLLSKISKVFQ